MSVRASFTKNYFGRLKIVDLRLRIVDCRLRIVDCRLKITCGAASRWKIGKEKAAFSEFRLRRGSFFPGS